MLLLDEVTTDLDVLARVDLLEFLRAESERGATILYATHILDGLEGTGGWLHSLGYRPGERWAAVGGGSEAGAGVLLVLGFLTPIAAAAIIGVMINAMVAVHGPKGLWNANGGIELPLVLSTAAPALAVTGPGSFSMDNGFGLSLSGLGWGAIAIAIGVIAGVTVSGMRKEEELEAEQAEERRRAA